MGRYYSGDIEGKFMFAVQPSDAGEQFGAERNEPGYIDYYVNRENYELIVERLQELEKIGGVNRVKKMFDENEFYNDNTMIAYNVSREDLANYADWNLGNKMKEFFDQNPDREELYFTAEL